MGVVFKEENKAKIQHLTSSITSSKTSSKSTCASWKSYFNEGEGSQGGVVLKPLIVLDVVVRFAEWARGCFEQLCVPTSDPPHQARDVALVLIYLGSL